MELRNRSLRERLKVKLTAIFRDLFHLERDQEYGEDGEPRELVKAYLEAHPDFAKKMDPEMLSHLHTLGEQLFGQPALAL